MSLTHLDADGSARMVDVSGKPVTARQALAEAVVSLSEATYAAMLQGNLPKGDVFGVARIAGIQAAKRCSELIPLCHGLPLDGVDIDFIPVDADHRLLIRARCTTAARTGVEMEALTAVSVAALTVYDMCKGLDKGVVIDGVRLLEKRGGKSGLWRASNYISPVSGTVRDATEVADRD